MLSSGMGYYDLEMCRQCMLMSFLQRLETYAPSLVLTNSEVHKLLSDFSPIGHDLLARGASNAADSLHSDPEALAHVDETAPRLSRPIRNRR
jgi:hypothetical protein